MRQTLSSERAAINSIVQRAMIEEAEPAISPNVGVILRFIVLHRVQPAAIYHGVVEDVDRDSTSYHRNNHHPPCWFPTGDGFDWPTTRGGVNIE